MQFSWRRPGRTRLLPRQAEITDEHRVCRIAEVIDLRHTANAPTREPGYKVSDACIAFPPALVCIHQSAHDDRQARWFRRIGNVPGFVLRAAKRAQHVDLAFIRVWQRAAVAYAHHLCSTSFGTAILGRLARNVREIARMGRIRHVDERGAVVFLLSGKRIRLRAAVVANVGDPALPLLVNGRLIGTASLQVVIADHLHIALLFLLRLSRRSHSQKNDQPCQRQASQPGPDLCGQRKVV